MRLSDLVHRPVVDSGGRSVGYVQDVRAVQDGPVLGSWGAAFRVEGLIVTRRRWTSVLGFDAGRERGPAAVARLVGMLLRRSHFVPWEDVVSWDGERIAIAVREEDLRPVTVRRS